MSGRSARARSTASTPSAAVATISTSSMQPEQHRQPVADDGLVVGDQDADGHAGTSISTRQPSAVGPADIVPPARSIRSRSPSSPWPPPIPSRGGAGRDAVVDRQRGAVGLVAHGDGRARAGRIARDVRQRLLRAAVEREARIGRERPCLALDPQRHVEVHVGLVAVDQRRELRRRVGSASPRSAPTAWRAFASPALTSSLARSIASLQTAAGVLAVGELPRPLELDRGAGERMREHVVQLARDPAALGDRRRARLLIARILELRRAASRSGPGSPATA